MGFNNRASWIPALYLIQLTLDLSFIQLQLPSERLCTRLKKPSPTHSWLEFPTCSRSTHARKVEG